MPEKELPLAEDEGDDKEITAEDFLDLTVQKLLELDREAIEEEDYETSDQLQGLAEKLLGIEPDSGQGE